MLCGFLLYTAAYGAVAGTAIATMPWAKWVAGACGGVGAVVMLIASWRLPGFTRMPIRNARPRRAVECMTSALTGTVLATFYGILVAAFAGAALGAVAGMFLRKVVRFERTRLFQFFPGIVPCAAAGGAIAQGVYLNLSQARVGLCYGTLIGTGVGISFCGCVTIAATVCYFLKRFANSHSA